MNIEQIKANFDNVKWVGKKCYFGLPISFTTYILTDTKLIIRRGLLSIVEEEVELYKVIDKSISYPLSQRIFDCGTIKLVSRDSDTPTEYLQSIQDPRKVKQLLDTLIDAQRDKYSIRGRDMFGGAGHVCV